jgi:hypothetical protein
MKMNPRNSNTVKPPNPANTPLRWALYAACVGGTFSLFTGALNYADQKIRHWSEIHYLYKGKLYPPRPPSVAVDIVMPVIAGTVAASALGFFGKKAWNRIKVKPAPTQASEKSFKP